MDRANRLAQAVPPDAPHSERKVWRPPEVVDSLRRDHRWVRNFYHRKAL